MDYKEKYEQALEKASKLRVQNPFDTVGQMVEHIFPELKESENERIKSLIKGCIYASDITPEGRKEIFAWLEKQDEQKLDDNVEPNFHKGDWIVDNCGYVWKIKGILDKCYRLEGMDGGESLPTIEWVDEHFHLWIINDAKDGDVLVASDESIFIYAGSTDIYAKFYVALTNYGAFNFDGGNWEDKNIVHPSTKMQCDFLFQKMKEVGYKWDSEKKELKRITKFKIGDKVHCGDENQPITIIGITNDSYITDSIIGPILFSEEDNWTKIEQNYTWCEDDEEILKWLCRIIHSQRMSKEITPKEELELGEWMDKWLNYNPQTKQGNKLDPDKVIEWIHKYWPFTRWDDITSTHDDAIEKFKKDFGL